MDDLHVVEAEGEQHRLLEPLVDLPLVPDLLGHPGLAGIEHVEGRLHRVTHGAFGAGIDAGPVFPGGLDGVGQIGGGGGV